VSTGGAETIHDCIVVGAGPAGSAAALQLARDGLDVVLLERGNRPGEKNVMSGVLITRTLHTLIPNFQERAPLQRRIGSDYARYILGEREALILPTVRTWGRDELCLAHTVFRSQFDAWFAQEAVNAGAELFTATLVEDLLWADGQVAGVRTRRGDLRARVVIGADGVNSTVAEKAGLLSTPTPQTASLIIRQVLDLPAETIEERFFLQPGEGMLSLFIGLVTGPDGKSGTYFTEIYTNLDSLSMTVEVPLDVLTQCGVANHDVLIGRERHPYIARLIRGATLREYQAHLIPYGGVGDPSHLYGEGVLLVGDAGRFVTAEGVGSWPAMASGVAAARTVRAALEKGDFSKRSLALYRDLLDEEGLLEIQRLARRALGRPGIIDRHPDQILHIALRYAAEWLTDQSNEPYSLWSDVYHSLLKLTLPWYARWPLGLAAWVDTRRWQRRRNKSTEQK